MLFHHFKRLALVGLLLAISMATPRTVQAADVACNLICPKPMTLYIELYRVGQATPIYRTSRDVYWFYTIKFLNVPEGRYYVRVTTWNFGAHNGQVGTVRSWVPWIQWLPDCRVP